MASIETEIVENLGTDHPKLEAFQKAVEIALLKRLQETDEELEFLKKENADKKRIRAEQTNQLHETQRLLKVEQRKLRRESEALDATTKDRLQLEAINAKYEKKLKELESIKKRAIARNDELKEKFNRVLTTQIMLTTRRVNMAGSVNATHTEASKAEEDFRKLQETKKAQDLYLDKLSQDMEDLEQKAIEYQAQADAMQQQTQDVLQLVRNSEAEAEKVRLEKMNLMQKWTTAVINIAKRDEALEGFRNAIKKQELALKEVNAEIDGTKQEIITCQEKHDQMTTLSQKAERLVAMRKAQIRRTSNQIEDAKLDLNKVNTAHMKTVDTLTLTTKQSQELERDLTAARDKVAKLCDSKRQLEEETLDLAREETASDKSTANASKQIRILREKTKILEERLIETQNGMSVTLEDIMTKTAYVDQQEEQLQELEINIDDMTKMLKQLEDGLMKAQAVIDKKQNLIDLKTKERDALIAAKEGAALSPLEADIQRTQDEIEATEAFCSAAKKAWLKYQNDFIQLVERRATANNSLTELTRKYLIMTEKRMKLETEIEAMKSSMADLTRRIEAKDGEITRIQRGFHKEKANYKASMEAIESKRAHEVNAMSDLVKMVDAIKKDVEDVAKEVEAEKIVANRAAEELLEWEEQLKSSSETRNMVGREKDNLEALRSDLHRRQVRAEQVDKMTKELMESLAECVGRRETLINRALATSAHRSTQRPQTTRIMLGKKIDDLSNRLKKLNRQEKELLEAVQDREAEEADLESKLEAKQSELRKSGDSVQALSKKIDSWMTRKDMKMTELLLLQTRAKWYDAIKMKKYRTAGQEDRALNEIAQLREQNEEIKKIINGLKDEFPYYYKALNKASTQII